MKDKIVSLINREDKKKPYTDSEIAKILGVRREVVTNLRNSYDIPDSRDRRKRLLVLAMSDIIDKNTKISERELTNKLIEAGFNVSRHTIRQYKSELTNKINDSDSNKSIHPDDKLSSDKKFKKPVYSSFNNIIGSDGSLKPYIKQAKAAMLYPPHGLHTLILGPTGVGKSELAESMFNFAKEVNMLSNKSSLVTFNCADYADNPQLLMSQLFGYVKGTFTGADEDKAGLVEKANGGILFLDEIHRLPPKGQELLFYLIDKGKFRRLGETNAQRKVKITIIAATTENTDSTLLSTFRRRIPMVIELPDLTQRPLKERYKIIQEFFLQESNRIQTPINVMNNVLRSLLLYECPGNVGQLRSDIQVSCAKGFLNFVTNNTSMMEIDIDDIPTHAKKGLLKTQNFRPEVEKLIKYNDFIAKPKSRDGNKLKDTEGTYTMPYEIYEFIEKRYHDLQGQISNQEVINYIIGNEIQTRVQNLVKQVETSVKPVEKKDLINIVGIEIVELVDKVLKIAGWKLGIVTDHLFYVLAIHLNATIARVKSGKTITNPQLTKIKEKYPKEFCVASEVVEVINSTFKVNLTEDEIGFIAMYLSSVTNKDETEIEGRVGVLVASHGNVSKAMVDVANRLLGVNFARGVVMSLDESPQLALERTMEVVKSLDEGKGVLLLVDMGSLVTFGEIITKKTGIKTRSISRVDTVMVIEAVRRAMLPDSDLDDIADNLEEKTSYVSRISYVQPEIEAKQRAIITMCITGQGTAIKIKGLIENFTRKLDSSIKIIPIGAVENNIKELIIKLKTEYDIVAIVGTINPNLRDIEYISLESIIKKSGFRRLKDIVEANGEKNSNTNNLHFPTTPEPINKLFSKELIIRNININSKEEVIDILANRLYDMGYVEKRFKTSVHEREELGPTFFLNGTSIPHGDPLYVKTSAIAVGVLNKPIDWDGIEVSVVLLLALKSQCVDTITSLQQFCEVSENIRMISSSEDEAVYELLQDIN